MEKLGSRLYHRVVKTYDNVPFRDQEADLINCVEILGPARFRIDRNGIGMNLAENLHAKYGGIIEEVNFTNEEKDRMANTARKSLENKDVNIVGDRERLRHWHSIKRHILPSGKFQYKPPQTEKHHADMFWADALAISGAFGRGGFRKPITFTSRAAENAIREKKPGGNGRSRNRLARTRTGRTTRAGALGIYERHDR